MGETIMEIIAPVLPSNLKYFDISRHWKTLNPIYESPEIRELALYEMNCYRECQALNYGIKFKEIKEFRYPGYFDSCDWRCDRRGRPPLYDNWICHSACHWIANINMAVVKKAFPNREWRVINSYFHSTVFDGDRTIYDTNLKGMNISIQMVIDWINNDPSSEIHPVGLIPYNFLEKDENQPEYNHLALT